MARIHPTITIPEGGAMPSLGSLMGTRVSFEQTDENGEVVRKPSLFGPEMDRQADEFHERYVAPQNRTNYYLDQIWRRDVPAKD